MTYCDLCVAEQQRRKQIVSETRTMIYAHLQVQEDDGASLLTSYSGYYLQISFSEIHPLMVLCLARAMPNPSSGKQRQMTNELNLQSILGSHAINDDVGCYSYRATLGWTTKWKHLAFSKFLNVVSMKQTVDIINWQAELQNTRPTRVIIVNPHERRMHYESTSDGCSLPCSADAWSLLCFRPV